MSLFQRFLKRAVVYVGERGKSNLPLLLLIVGCVFIFLPSMLPSCKILTVLGVWVWPFCFLYYCRLSEHRFSQAILYIFLAVGLCIRFYGVLGPGLEKESFVITALEACIFWVPFAWDVRYCTKDAPFVNTLVFPTVYSTLSLIFSACDLLPINNLAYAQYDNRPLFQIQSVVGEFGLTFLIAFVASMAVYVVAHRGEASARRIGLATLVGVFGLHVWGLVQMSQETSSDTIRVAQVLGPRQEVIADGYRVSLPYEQNLRSFNKIVESAYRSRAEILVFSEEAFDIADTNEGDFISNATVYARKFNIPILLTLKINDTDNSREGLFQNKAILIDGQGKMLMEYNKHKAEPLVESFDLDVGKGKIPVVALEIAGKKKVVSFVISYDANFSEFVRGIDPEVQVLFVPSRDWEGMSEFHYRSAASRAVEHGVNVVLTSYDGFSLVSNEYGREISRKSFDEVGNETVFMTDVPVSTHPTTYARVGSFMNYVYLILSLMFIGLGARRTRDGSIEAEADY